MKNIRPTHVYLIIMMAAGLFGAFAHGSFQHGMAVGALGAAAVAFGISLTHEATKK